MDEEPVRIPITGVFDLHSVPSRDAKAIVEVVTLRQGIARSASFKFPSS